MIVEERARGGFRLRSRFIPDGTIAEPSVRVVLAVFAAFVAVWTLYYTITEAPVAIKHDMAEAYAWGRQFQLGYNQHPPFWAWICGLWFSVFPRTGWAFALLSSLNAGIGLWGAWLLIGNFATGGKRVAAWALLLLTPLYTFYAYKYDANIIFISIWPWTLHYFVRSVRHRRIGDAVMFGVMVGVAMMSKYYALTLVTTCFLATFQHAWRRYFASSSPYISAAVAAAIFAPHVAWLVTHQAPPLRYLASLSDQGWDQVTDYALNTLFGALEMNLGVVLIVGAAAWISTRGRAVRRLPANSAPEGTVRVLAVLALAPLVLTIVSGVAVRTRLTPEMTIGTFPLLPLLLIELFGIRDTDRLGRVSAVLAAGLSLGALIVAPGFALARTYLFANAMSVAPLQEAAIAATKVWHERTSLPVMYVGGTDWYENALAFYSPDRPHVFVHFDYSRNLWVTPEAIARHGLLSVCVSSDKACLAETAAFATPETTRTQLTLSHKFWGHVANPVDIVVTVIPPRV